MAALAGSLPGAVGLAGFLAVSGAFFALDHAARRLASWPRIPAPPVRLVLREASRLLAVPVVLLAATIAVLPSRPPEVVPQGRRPALTRPEVQRVYLWLTLVVLVGTGGTALVFRWLRGRGDQAPPLVDAIETHVEAEEILEPESFESARYAPARGRVVRAYLRFLARAREAGFRLERHLTPGEIQDRVRASLKNDKRLEGIKVASVNNGLVLLAGKTRSLDEKLVAIESAYSVAGVRRVASEIETVDN